MTGDVFEHDKGASVVSSVDATPHANVAAFKKDIIELFLRLKGGHTHRWVYHGGERGAHNPTGGRLWAEFLKQHGNPKGYYIPGEERELIDWSIGACKRQSTPLGGKLRATFKDADTVVDLGSGDRLAVMTKAMPIVFGLGDQVRIYAPVDYSKVLLDEAAQTAREFIASVNARKAANQNTPREIAVTPLNGDFYRGRDSQGDKLVLPGTNRAGLLLGSTITNMGMKEGEDFDTNVRPRIVRKIKQVNQLLREGTDGHCTVTYGYDANPDMQEAKSAYEHEVWSQLVVGIMSDVANVLKPKGGFNPLAWRHEMVVDEESHVIHQCVVATDDQKFIINLDPKTDQALISANGNKEFVLIQINKGDRFVIKNNFKYPLPVFQSMIEEAGGKNICDNQHPTGRMVLQITEVPNPAPEPGN